MSSETAVVDEVIEVVEPAGSPTSSVDPSDVDHRALKPQLIPPDPALVESMECLPVPGATLEFADTSTQAGHNDAPLRASAMVEVGEGLTPGETWWLVALHYDWEIAAGDPRVVRLTNQPGLPAGERGAWIMSRTDRQGHYMWHHVKWEDEESFVRLQSVAAKALACLDVTEGSDG